MKTRTLVITSVILILCLICLGVYIIEHSARIMKHLATTQLTPTSQPATTQLSTTQPAPTTQPIVRFGPETTPVEN